MKKTIEILCMVVIFLGGFVLGQITACKRISSGRVISDTILVKDTVRERETVVRDSLITRYVIRTFPIHDTIARLDTLRDSIAVAVPIMQKTYKGDNYTAWVSGYEPQLDSIDIIRNTQIITNTIYAKPKRWGLGVQVGIGVTPQKIQPYVGVGLYYNLITF